MSSSETQSVASLLTDDEEIRDDPIGFPIFINKKKQFYKVIQEAGIGRVKPQKTDLVTIQIDESEEQQVKLDSGKLTRALQRGICSMKQGEVAELHIPQDYDDQGERVIKIYLKSWIIITDIKGDGNIIKTVETRGFGMETAGYKDDLIIDYYVFQDGITIHKSENFAVQMDPTQISNGLFEILKSMKIQEKATITINPEYFKENFQELAEGISQDQEVIAQIVVKDMKKVEDMYLDGSFYKRLIIDGDGKSIPNSNARVYIHYQLELEGQLVLDNFDKDPMLIIMDEDNIPSLWTHCLRQMKEGDRIQVECNLLGLHSNYLSDGLLDEMNCSSYAGSNTTSCILTIQMVSFTMGKTNYNFTLQERGEEALRIKEAATKLFRRELYDRALEKYETANSTLQPVADDPHNFRPIQLTLLSNICLCHMKQQNWHEGLNFANQILNINPLDIKASFRKAQCRMQLGDLTSAREDFKYAKQVCMDAQDQIALRQINTEIDKLTKLIKQRDNQERAKYSRLFS